ncbi:MAG TPA: DUF599 family protein [Rhizobiales bacterium]|nr:DUF599 family protein [Hyphomicrobiales bacterium]
MGGTLPLTLPDVAAIALFAAVWFVYALAVEGKVTSRVSLTAAMNLQREAWMQTMARRELRMIDTSIMAGLQQGTAFFASTSLIALGGSLALIRQTEEALSVLAGLPFMAPVSPGLFEIKAVGLTVLFAYSFFKFAWSYRLFNYCSILIGAVPVLREGSSELDAAVSRAARMNVLAGRHFNAGLRGIFFSIGYLGWFVGAAPLAAATLLVAAVLVRRQFFSAARLVVCESPDQSGPGRI